MAIGLIPLAAMRPIKFAVIASTLGLLSFASLAVGCTSTTPNRIPMLDVFPSVTGEDLDGNKRRVPEDFRGAPLIVLVGYVQNAQFDLDRWLIGLSQFETPVAAVELPTIAGLVPGLFAGSIDNGMRRGIPSEDWKGVITIYGGDARKVVDFFGNENPRNGRVALLDQNGRVVWFHDRGFSASHMKQLDRKARALRSR